MNNERKDKVWKVWVELNNERILLFLFQKHFASYEIRYSSEQNRCVNATQCVNAVG